MFSGPKCILGLAKRNKIVLTWYASYLHGPEQSISRFPHRPRLTRILKDLVQKLSGRSLFVENHTNSRISRIWWNSLIRSARIDHSKRSGDSFPLGNVRFRGVSKKLEHIFNVFQFFVAGSRSSRSLDVTKIMQNAENHQNQYPDLAPEDCFFKNELPE